ncbi:hypothetical protein P43SY_003080 [Pythium insidiosum]|uniref:Uncharacterized protein n=1 Tax=Pythium insidiosum TaxID=114742 RepID=A0AAD5QEB1_PYTIN|nr:hypothetical protein P43SY_003080 [Pythium insidiosum]
MFARVPLRDVAGREPRRVHLVGVAVALRQEGNGPLQLVLDDGTGLALVQRAASDLQSETRVGCLISCFGQVEMTPTRAFNMTWSLSIRAQHLTIAEDLNVETLRMLDTVQLWPQHSTGSVVRLQTPPSHRFQSMHQGTTAIPAPSLVAPVEYQFHVSSADLELLESGRKALEIRLNSPPYSAIRATDRVKFNGKIVRTIVAIRKYAQLSTALQTEDVNRLLPALGNASVGAVTQHLRQFISVAEERQSGIVVLEFAAPPPPAQAAPAEDWSARVFKYLSSSGQTGCRLRDLQFAFPSLPVHRLEAILADLQMDGAVYQQQDVFRLL